MLANAPCIEKAFGNVDNAVHEFSRRPMWSPRRDRVDHVRYADTTTVLLVAERKLENARDMRRYLDFYFLSRFRFAGDRTFRERRTGGPRYLRDRAEKCNECGKVVWTHIQNRPASGLVEKLRIRISPLPTMVSKERRRPDRLPDLAVVNQLAAGL